MHFTNAVAAAILSFSALAAAQYSAYGYDNSLYARNADYDDHFDVYAREADYDNYDLYAREAEYDDHFNVYARAAAYDDLMEYIYRRTPVGGKGTGPGSVVEGILGAKNKFDEYQQGKVSQALRNSQQPSPFVKPAKPITSSHSSSDSGKHVQNTFAKMGLTRPAKD
jgi:hypothetical protein